MFEPSEMFHFTSGQDDVIYMDNSCYLKLLKLWANEVEITPTSSGKIASFCTPPTDLMISKTVPLPSFMLKTKDCGFLVLTDVVSFDKICAVSSDGLGMWYKVLEDGKGWAIHLSEPDSNTNKHMYDALDMDREYKRNYFLSVLDAWYGIQIALLHPQLQTLFKKPTKEKVYTREGTGKDRKRVVKYVRKHYITAEGIDEALYGHGHRDFKRKTMAWYVIGHWRQYKNGTRKFINGYWKGPLREMKRNLDGGRIRQLAIQEA